MQYKNKKNLYKIIFITILLGFTISLVGCNWLSFGLLNIFDPQAQMRLNYTEVDLGEGTISLEIYSLNEVEFIGSGFEYEYYVGTTKITSLDKMVGVTFYVAPSTSPGTPGPITKIDNMPLYFQEVLDYLTLNPLITELTCNITMVGTDGAGHSISETVTVELPALQPGIDFVPPTAVIIVTPGTAGEAPFSVVLDASSSTDDRGIASYGWSFGDGGSGSGDLVSHTYVNSGVYIIVLTVTDHYGNKGYATVVITVGDTSGEGAPTADIQVTPGTTGTVPFTVAFDASGSTVSSESGCASCTIVSYSWDFGDTSTGSGIATTHTYVTAGTYIVILTVTDSNGKIGYATVVITVIPEGEVAIGNIILSANPGSNIPGGTSTISAIVTNTEGDVAVNGTTVYFYTNSGLLSATSADTTNGIATVDLTLSNNMQYGEIAQVTAFIGTVTDSVEITCIEEIGPEAKITTIPSPPIGIAPLEVYFDAYESTSESGIVSYEWDFGDGTTGLGDTINHTYSNVGTYTVVLAITDNNGKKGYDNVYVEVGKAPIAVINVTPGNTGIAPYKVYFDAYESTSESGIVNYEWEFGDGTTGTGVTAENTYDVGGIYIVYLTITDSNGYKAYDSVTITINEVGVPTAVIDVTPSTTGIAPFTVYFDASQSSGPSSIVSYDWNFGDTGTDTGITTSHTYTAAGTYTVILTVTDSNTNTGYDSVIITVYEAGVPSTLTLQANPVTVTAGGGASLITATVEDAGGDPVTDGTVVTFIATSPGILSGITTTTGGIATATLTLSNAGTETISSTVGATSGTATDNVTVYCPPPTPTP